MAAFTAKLGFAKINCAERAPVKRLNFALKQIDSEYICIMAQDIVVTKDWLENLVAKMISRKLTFAAPLTNVHFYPTLHTHEPIVSIDDVDAIAANIAIANKDKSFVALLLVGDCLVLKKSLLKKIGCLDERFNGINTYSWGELCIRATYHGIMPTIIGDVFACDCNADPKDDIPNPEHEKAVFSAKWGFSFTYSTVARVDLIDRIDFSLPNIAILEVGCACGATLLDIKNHRPDAILRGIEINKYSASIAKAICPVTAANIETEELPQDMKFDYILCGDVLEHLINPLAALKKLKAILKTKRHYTSQPA
jgi:hypothetical protein